MKIKKPCFNFAKGKCSEGVDCHYSHDSDPESLATSANLPSDSTKKPCFNFAKGECSFGVRCYYSHDSNPHPHATFANPPSDSTKKPCFNFAQGECNFGVHCHYAHDKDPNLSSTTANPPVDSIKRESRSDNPYKCKYYWETGTCKQGFKCTRPHRKNPALKKHKDDKEALNEGWQRVDSSVVQETRAVDVVFPTFTAVKSRASDNLLVPTKFLTHAKVKAVIHEASKDNGPPLTAAVIENLVLALNASNGNNEYWVSP